MGYAARLSPAAKEANRLADMRRMAQHIRSVDEFETVIRRAAPRTRAQLRKTLIPMLRPHLAALMTPAIGLEAVDG